MNRENERITAIGFDPRNTAMYGVGCCDGGVLSHAGREPVQDAEVRDCLAIRTANTGANGCGVAVEVCHTLDLASGQGVLVYCE